MPKAGLDDLVSFQAVAQHRSFTRAAAQLGVTQSALSQTIRGLETRLGLRLLTRTTRTVVPTEGGNRLLAHLEPALDRIEAGIKAVGELRDKPAGTIRISATENAINSVLWPALRNFLSDHPAIQVELTAEPGSTDIVAERYDAGVRPGETVAQGMVAVRISPDLRMAVAGSPSYFASHPIPRAPQDLVEHECINIRLANGSLYPWEFAKKRREVRVRATGRLVFSTSSMILRAALDGYGLAYLMEDQMASHLANGSLVRVLADWCEPFSGYHLYYPNRRQPTAAFSLLLDALRYRG